jgi:hypothetical protein
MKNIIIIITLCSFFACKKTDNNLNPTFANREDIAGTYFLINDPLSCSMPTTSKLIIEKTDDGYKISAAPINSNKTSFYANAKAEKADGIWNVFIEDKNVGIYQKSKYFEDSKTKEDIVLFIHADKLNFMGKK